MQTELNKFSHLGSPRTGSDKQMIQLDPHTSKSTSIFRIAFIEPGCMRRSGSKTPRVEFHFVVNLSFPRRFRSSLATIRE
jgi:hypothetical protein